MPDTLAPTLTAPQLILLDRKPATAGFIMRKLLAGSLTDFRTRKAALECARAELAWAYADWVRIVSDRGLSFDVAAEREPAWGTPAWHLTLLPVEKAALTVLNCWEHVHVKEYRMRECIARLRAQRKAGWHQHALGTAAARWPPASASATPRCKSSWATPPIPAHWRRRRWCNSSGLRAA